MSGMTDTKTTLHLGDRVLRTEGRPKNVGQEGTVTHICPDVIGSAGDILVIVTKDNGTTFQCYDRQLAFVR